MNYEVYEIKDLGEEKLALLMDIWHRAVQHTYNFIKGPDIITMRPIVKKNIQELDHLCGVNDERGNIIAFMGVKGQTMMSIFVEPFWMRKGIGGALVRYGIEQYKVNLVVVNEENEDAIRFFRSNGFAQKNRSIYDEYNLPYPVVTLYHE